MNMGKLLSCFHIAATALCAVALFQVSAILTEIKDQMANTGPAFKAAEESTLTNQAEHIQDLIQKQPEPKEISNKDQQSSLSESSSTTVRALQEKFNWDCDLYWCKDGDQEIYPLSVSLVNSLYNATSVTVRKDTNSSGDNIMAVVFDPTCPSCKELYRTSMRKLLDEGYSIRLITTLFNDTLSTRGITLVRGLLCSKDRYNYLENLMSGHTLEPISDQCPLTFEQTKAQIQKTKATLSKYSLDGVTPLVFTPKAMWFHATDYSTTVKYLELRHE